MGNQSILMGADALTQAAGELAPRERTNYFDPQVPASIIARYANAGMAAEDAALADKAARGLEASRFERADQAIARQRQKRQLTEWDRADVEHQNTQDYRAQRGEFLSKLAGLDPNAEDYETQRSQLYAELPIEAQKDDAVRDIVAAKDKVSQNRLAIKEREDYRKSILDERDAQNEQAAAARAAEAGLTLEEINGFRDPATKRVDPVALSYAAGNRSREIRGNALEQTRAPSKEEKAAKQDIEEAKILLADQKAFPRQIPQFYAKYSQEGDNTTDAQSRNRADYEAAKAYDENPYASEVNSARNMAKQEYVNVGGMKNVDAKLKDKREAFWLHANAGKGEAPAAAPAAAVKGVKTAAKVLDAAAAAKFKEAAKGDRALAEKLAREAGYEF